MSKSTPGYLGDYRLLNVVNTGHHCQVWQAYHDGRQSFVAVKSLLEKFRNDLATYGQIGPTNAPKNIPGISSEVAIGIADRHAGDALPGPAVLHVAVLVLALCRWVASTQAAPAVDGGELVLASTATVGRPAVPTTTAFAGRQGADRRPGADR